MTFLEIIEDFKSKFSFKVNECIYVEYFRKNFIMSSVKNLKPVMLNIQDFIEIIPIHMKKMILKNRIENIFLSNLNIKNFIISNNFTEIFSNKIKKLEIRNCIFDKIHISKKICFKNINIFETDFKNSKSFFINIFLSFQKISVKKITIFFDKDIPKYLPVMRNVEIEHIRRY